MTAVLRHLPFTEHADEVHVGLERVPVKAYQIVVWVSISGWRTLELPPSAQPFPAILDTGHNHHFSIQAEHLREWARLPAGNLQKIGEITIRGQRLDLRGAHAWLHKNVPGRRDKLLDRPP